MFTVELNCWLTNSGLTGQMRVLLCRAVIAAVEGSRLLTKSTIGIGRRDFDCNEIEIRNKQDKSVNLQQQNNTGDIFLSNSNAVVKIHCTICVER